jgi:predicted component of type VI protein secretion system
MPETEIEPVPLEEQKPWKVLASHAPRLSEMEGNAIYLDQLKEAALRAETGEPSDQDAVVAEQFVQRDAGLNYLRANRPQLRGKAAAAAKLKALIDQRVADLRRQKEQTLQSVIGQVRPLETTWRTLDLAYANCVGAGAGAAKFYLVGISKENLLKEHALSSRVAGDDPRRKQSLIEALLRDRSDRFGGNPYCMVVLPWTIEAGEVDFFKGLGQVGRKFRCPVVANLGATLVLEPAGKMPAGGGVVLGRLKSDKNLAWKKLTQAKTPEETEALSYLVLMAARVAVRNPYRFQKDVGAFADAEALYREGTVWAPASAAFAGKVERLGSDFGVHLMPAGKVYGRVSLPALLPSDNERYRPLGGATGHHPLETDFFVSEQNKLWEQGLITLARDQATGEIFLYGDCTLLASPDTIKKKEPMISLGVRLTHDHVLHYCNRYLYEQIGSPVDSVLIAQVKRDLTTFLHRNTGEHRARPLSAFETPEVKRNPADAGEMLVKIEFEVKTMMRKATVALRVKKTKSEGIEEV